MAENDRMFGDRWRVVRPLGKGGQGQVYEVADMGGLASPDDLARALKEGLRNIQQEIHMVNPDVRKFDELINAIRVVVAAPDAPRAALKQLLPVDEAVNATTALARMKAELDALDSVGHPALVRLLDQHIEEHWYVMEYFRAGTLDKHPERFRGRVLDALLAFRPLVEAAQALHAAGIVHRDIKPANVFVADDGHLVLGDCGLAIKLDNAERLTDTFENVGTRDYQPPWTYAMRLADVRPNFDVFGLAKLLWAMISGRPRFPLEDFDIEPHDLRRMFPDEPGVLFVHRILKKCVVRRETQCTIPDAAALLDEIDKSIQALRAGAVVPTTTGKMRCRFCGLGIYQEAEAFAVSGSRQSGSPRRYYCCDHCGHLEFFVDLGKQAPPAWTE
jgi:serine/threonine protein kinase